MRGDCSHVEPCNGYRDHEGGGLRIWALGSQSSVTNNKFESRLSKPGCGGAVAMERDFGEISWLIDVQSEPKGIEFGRFNIMIVSDCEVSTIRPIMIIDAIRVGSCHKGVCPTAETRGYHHITRGIEEALDRCWSNEWEIRHNDGDRRLRHYRIDCRCQWSFVDPGLGIDIEWRCRKDDRFGIHSGDCIDNIIEHCPGKCSTFGRRKDGRESRLGINRVKRDKNLHSGNRVN